LGTICAAEHPRKLRGEGNRCVNRHFRIDTLSTLNPNGIPNRPPAVSAVSTVLIDVGWLGLFGRAGN
jgi:hypothetical protein